MADTVMTNTYLPSGPGTSYLERESLAEMVEQVFRTETPLYSNMRKGTAEALREDWGTEDIGAIVVPTPRNMGFVASPKAPFTPARLSNWLELVAEEGGVSHSKQKVDTAGNVGSLAHQKLLRGYYLTRGLNKLLHSNQAFQHAAEPYTMATPSSYITNFQSVAGTPGTAPTGDGSNTYTPGTTPDDFDGIAPIDTVLEKASFTRGFPGAMYMAPRRAREFSRLPDASIAANRVQITPQQGAAGFVHVGTVDTYYSDFGVVEKIVDIDADPTKILALDHDFWEVRTLADMNLAEHDLGVRGSGDEFFIEWQGTVICTLPQAQALIEGYKVPVYS